jgi:hypothetical protein
MKDLGGGILGEEKVKRGGKFLWLRDPFMFSSILRDVFLYMV